MDNQIRSAISKGMRTLCFTEHMDYEYPESPKHDRREGPEFWLDTESYLAGYREFKEKYEGKIELLFGVELGLQPHLVDWNTNYVNQHDFDYIIGSAHTIGRRDPYYPSFYEGRSEREAYEQYFIEAYEDIKLFDDFDSFGHLDYVVRYGPNKNRDYSYETYRELIDPILKLLMEKGIALEINTGGYRKGLGGPNPGRDVIMRYRELGGELITIGSDAHTAETLAADFASAEALLLECGFKNYAVFKGRKSVLYPLG